MFGLGAPEVLLILGIGVFLFGHKLPDLARSMGRSVTEFRKGISGVEDELRA